MLSEVRYLSMPDPSGATRIELIAAKLKAAQGDSSDLDEVYDRIEAANKENDGNT